MVNLLLRNYPKNAIINASANNLEESYLGSNV